MAHTAVTYCGGVVKGLHGGWYMEGVLCARKQDFCSSKTLPRVLCPSLELPVQEKHGPVRTVPEKNHKNY